MRSFAPEVVEDGRGRPYRNFYPAMHLNAYCLMGNHFHLLIYQFDEKALSIAMKSILTSYSMYFNRKYKQRGSLFESTYKAVPITEDSQLMHITRYIHLNHSNYGSWSHSSYQDYINGRCRSWIDSSLILDLFTSTEQYVEFVSDYEDLQRERDIIKKELAAG
jgi:putative transposase